MIEDKIQQVRTRVQDLRSRALRAPAGTFGRLDDAFDELGSTLNELEDANRGLGQVLDELQRSRQQYVELFEVTPAGLLVTDLDGSIQIANRAAAIQLNVVPKFLIARSIREFLSGESYRALPALLRRLCLDSRPMRWNAVIRPHSGATFEVIAEIAILRDDSGAASRLLWMLGRESRPEPAEGPVRGEQPTLSGGATRVALDRARQLIGNSAVGIILVEDRIGAQICVNSAGQELLGPPSDAPGLNGYASAVLGPTGEGTPLEEICLRRAVAGEVITGVELLIRRLDGLDCWAHACAGPICDPTGAIVGAVIILDDISRLKQDEQRRAEWMSIVAHDLRAPLAVIKGYAQMLQRNRAAAQSADSAQSVIVGEATAGLAVDRLAKEGRALEAIIGNVERLTRMIGDLLDASRIESQQLRLQWRTIDLASLIRGVVDQMSQAAAPKVIRLVEVSDDAALSVADPERIEQVLENLIQNAVKYSTPSSEIRVGLTRQSTDLCIWVSNEGPGLSVSDLAQVFERFSRPAASSTNPSSGLGLGLYIARRLVEAHGGRIWADSTPGATTTFQFTLPIASPQ